ncbi:MAG: type IV toxin-antitoxin system AbiEi family antitoxin domain-containing protein [Chitinispirillaceae bacterium]|nr:type IV toxin-antitoxin system AbiEi family antitoxin domain-containing protein [Chitinispirillaceae bacterium]
MKLLDLKSRFRHRPVFRLTDLHPTQPHSKHELVQLNRWAKEGQVIRIARGLYTLPDQERGAGLDPLWLANNLYSPSYVSLQYALSYHGLIPEAVGTVTSVTTRKTVGFSTPMGLYSYRHLKKEDFFGFTSLHAQGAGQEFWMATPEKAVIDFIHLCVSRSSLPVADLFTQGYRFQNLEVLNKEAFTGMADRFTAKTARRHIEAFCKLLAPGGNHD